MQAESIWEQFVAWKKRGRGWDVWDEPVSPEPAFEPFFGYVPTEDVVDDGVKPTPISRLVERLSQWLSGDQVVEADDVSESPEPEPRWIDEACDIVEWQIAVPPTLTVTGELTEQFLLNVSSYSQLLSFEIIGQSDQVTIQLSCAEGDAPNVRGQLEAHFPDAIISRPDKALTDLWKGAEGEAVVVEFGLSHPFMLPLATRFSSNADPLTGVISALSGFTDNSLGLVQVIFEPIRHPWAESLWRSVTYQDGRGLFTDSRDFLRSTREKISRPLYGVVLRCAARSSEEGEAWNTVKNLARSLTPLDSPVGNELIALSNEQYPQKLHEEDVLHRRSRRSGMILNIDELMSLVHIPSSSVRIPSLKRSARRTKKAPASVLNHSLVLGENIHHDDVAQVTLDRTQRGQHLHVIGVSGTGKSTLLSNLMIQDLNAGNGFAVLDPHGDLVDEVLKRVPPERIDDVILFDPADDMHPIGFNILSAHSELERNLLASDLVAVFRRLSSSWGDQMNALLSNAILAMLESREGGTLLDLRRFLVEKSFRYSFLETVNDPEIKYYWTKQHALISGKSLGPVLTRLDTFLRPKTLRYMVAQKESNLDFADIMDNGKVLLCRLSHGAIGEENAYLLGALLVSKFHQLAMGRQQQDASKRQPFYLILDEAHHFATPSMASILSGARKYSLGLVLAHQELHQVESKTPELASALSNAYTRICFRVGEQDAKKLEGALSTFDAADLQNLETGEAICRVGTASADFNLHTAPMPAVDVETARHISERIITNSREKYATERSVVEQILAQSYPNAAPPSEPKRKKKETPVQVPRKEAPEDVVPETEEPVATPVAKTEVVQQTPVTVPEQTPGRGGVKHKSLQRLIKQWAEGMGYGAQIEMPILHGRGAVDVVLRKGDVSIACEISVTTPTQYECENLKKCLQADFTHITMICDDARRLKTIKETVEKNLEAGEFERVQFMIPQELFGFIEEFEKEAASGETVRGYRVTVSRSTHGEAERATRVKSIKRTIADAVVRGKRGKKDDD